jgi:hypothetical protein
MALNLGIRRTCLLALVSLAAICTLTDAIAQVVTYSANETSKSMPISRAQLVPGLTVDAQSQPMARVCDVPDGATAVRTFVAAISARPESIRQSQARQLLRGLKGFAMTNSGENQTTTTIGVNGWSSIGFPDQRDPRWWSENYSASIPVSAADQTALNSGQAVTKAVRSNCLTVPEFKGWLGEVVRVLEQYYQITN